MSDMDLNTLFTGVTLSGWAVAAGALAVLLLLVSLIRPRRDNLGGGGGSSGLGTLAQIGLVVVVAGAAYLGLKQFEDSARFTERRAIEDRAANLLNQASQPGSVLGCLTAAVTPALDEACERQIFAEPQRLASAIGMTAERIALLLDATNLSAREPAFLDRFDHLRKSLESDPFGIVAHILSVEHKCIPDSCTRYRLLRDTSKVKANLESNKFDGLLQKYSPAWANLSASMRTRLMPTMPPVNTIGGPAKENELPSANSAAVLPPPSGQTSTAPLTAPQVRGPEGTPTSAAPATEAAPPPAPTPRPAAAKQKEQKAAPARQTQAPAAAKKKGPPEPVGGLPRVTARGSDPPAADDDDDDAPAPPPAPTRGPGR